jgi:hypothetical protein
MFDLTAYTVVLALAVGIFLPTAFSEKGSEFAFQLVIPFSWIFVESLLLSLVGTTPGKALFKIRLSLDGCDSIPFIFAFYRSLRVWWRGLGVGVPIVTLFTLVHAERVLSRDGVTSWDKELGFRVAHEKIGPIRIVTAVAWFGIWFGLTIAGSFMETS